MHANTISRNSGERGVQCFNMLLNALEVGCFIQVAIHHVAAEPQIGRVELQQQARVDDGFVLMRHRLRQCLKVGVVVHVVLIGLKQ